MCPRADFTTPLQETLGPLSDLPETSDANISFNKFKARASVLGPYSGMATIGANPAVMFAIVLMIIVAAFIAWRAGVFGGGGDSKSLDININTPSTK